MNTRSRHHFLRSFLWKFWLIFVALFVIFGCGLSLNKAKPTASEEDINSSVEATLNAEFIQNMHLTETASALVIPDTPVPPQPTPQEISIQTPTAEIPTEIPVQTQPALTEPPATLTEIPINDWKTQYWVPLGSGCQNNAAKCWKLNDDFKTVGGTSTAFLTSTENILIEENWPSPYLVFWNKRNLRFEAMLSLFIDGTLSNVKVIPTGTNQLWKEETLDLSRYKGKNIRVQISCPVGMQYVNSWFINDFRIVPNYQP
jgi:hypothetical protein